MTTTIPVKALELLPGSTMNVRNISWEDFEEILAELGESSQIKRGVRAKHSDRNFYAFFQNLPPV